MRDAPKRIVSNASMNQNRSRNSMARFLFLMGRGERVDQPLLLADVRKEQLLGSPRLGLAVSRHSHDILDCRASCVDGFIG